MCGGLILAVGGRFSRDGPDDDQKYEQGEQPPATDFAPLDELALYIGGAIFLRSRDHRELGYWVSARRINMVRL